MTVHSHQPVAGRLVVVAAAALLLAGCSSAAAHPALPPPPSGCADTAGLRVCDAWIRFAPTGDTVAAYLTVTSTGPADTLTAVHTDLGGIAMLHVTVHSGPVDTMKMVATLPVPAGGTLTLAPDGNHVMIANPGRTAAPRREHAADPHLPARRHGDRRGHRPRIPHRRTLRRYPMTPHRPDHAQRRRTSPRRRTVLAAAAGALAGAAVAAPATAALARTPAAAADPQRVGTATVAFHGAHQAGVATPAPAHLLLLALDLTTTDQGAVRTVLADWTATAARLTTGHPDPGDTSPELGAEPASLTVTLGLGPGFFTTLRLDDRRPGGLAPIPAFARDRLDPAYTGGDLLLQICADDPIVVDHTARRLLTRSGGAARVRWRQRGFSRAAGTAPPTSTGRNLMGQLDGTNNPQPGTAQFDAAVWVGDPGQPAWLHGGTFLVVRRIRMDLDAWARLPRGEQEAVIGRRKDTGAPLGGHAEHDPPDLTAADASGRPVIPLDAHIRLAAADNNFGARMYRRGYSYDDSTPDLADAGLIFCAYQADIRRGFLPVQARLTAGDALNPFITHVGSAVFAIPPGTTPGQPLAAGLWTG